MVKTQLSNEMVLIGSLLLLEWGKILTRAKKKFVGTALLINTGQTKPWLTGARR
jgi:hypothetical protein